MTGALDDMGEQIANLPLGLLAVGVGTIGLAAFLGAIAAIYRLVVRPILKLVHELEDLGAQVRRNTDQLGKTQAALDAHLAFHGTSPPAVPAPRGVAT